MSLPISHNAYHSLPLSSNAHYHDVSPIAQDEGVVATIAYTSEFVHIMSYFRAFLLASRFTLAGYHLSTLALSHNSANYSIWHYRRECLLRLACDAPANKSASDAAQQDKPLSLHDERAWLNDMAHSSPKNYQLWYHRRWLIEQLNAPLDELQQIADILEMDSKNYHAWSHRHWLLVHFSMYVDGLAMIDALLASDIKNNSAWNQRWSIMRHLNQTKHNTIEDDVKYVMDAIDNTPNNESAWNYLEGLTKLSSFSHHSSVHALVGRHDSVRFAHSLSVELCVRAHDYNKAMEHVQQLIKCDQIREKYWRYRAQQINKLSSKQTAAAS